MNFLEQASDGSIAVNKVIFYTESFDFVCYVVSFLRILTLLFLVYQISTGVFSCVSFHGCSAYFKASFFDNEKQSLSNKVKTESK